MNGFKILAIRPSKDCDKQFLKNLNSREIYKFYQDYNFVLDEEKDKVLKIQHTPTIPQDIYGKNINISAIVGKNGSGKSTIVELFCMFVFCLSEQLDLINIENFKETHKLSLEDQKRLSEEVEKFKKFNCEIYFLKDNKIYAIIKHEDSFKRILFKKELNENKKLFIADFENTISINNSKVEEDKAKFLRDSFFYSILANYSLYGLNTNETGIWLKSIFHKNDGYQTPIVLNPTRTEGKIDINRQTYLSKARLLGNVFMDLKEGHNEKNSLRNLVNDKIVKNIILKLDFEKFTLVDEDNLKPNQVAKNILDIGEKSIYLEYTERFKKTHFHLLVKAFHPNFELNDSQLSNTIIKKVAIEYVLKKAFDISKKYPQFLAFKNRAFRVNSKLEAIENYFRALAHDFTHSTFKIRQALNYLVHDIYRFENEIEITFLLSSINRFGIADKVNKLRNELLMKNLEDLEGAYSVEPDTVDIDENEQFVYRKHSLVNYLPPSFFEIDFEFKDEGLFKDLSSGEKQMIFSINSIIYHLINLDSIYSMKLEEGISYNCFNIILDEIELYFHPEFQRIYINELIKSIGFIESNDYKFNIIFLTHSPFILSDIPSSNILKLENGNTKYLEDDDETYAANVHDILAKGFFLKNGFMGEFAKEKIKDLIRYLTFDENQKVSEDNEKEISNWTPELAKEFIEMIGEPLLKFDLKELYLSKFYNEENIDDEISRLQELKRQRKK